MGNRARVSLLFDFDYRIECYVPAPLRKHGYFSLPILYGNNLVGRMDAKAERKEKRLVVHRLTLEKRIQGERLEHFLIDFASELRLFAAFNESKQVAIGETRPGKLKNSLVRQL